ncbi:unnamed protein product [Eruca vesicaria subsp. sativa]|uniref:Exostosin GT47 domain-containing protein n=1 Tax=Eruca vesicaria subsp. sativa TaxID=29727 RepID=A0ABC8KQI6_ERUVS|nr:unnamed protein product [Eruca vesicaria subsp. sativa]
MEKFNPRKKKIVRKQAPDLWIHILPILVFSILFVPHINQETLNITLKTKQGETDTCAGRYVYIHNLPSRFNDDLIESCESYVELRNKCKYLVNSGFGPPILEVEIHNHTTRVLTTETGSWYSTNQFMLEVIFREKMRHYECLTNDSSLSSAIFVPFYAGFDVRRFWGYNVKLRDELGEDLAQWLRERPEWRKMHGRDHFFVTGRVGRDFRRASDQDSDWGNKLMRLPEFENMTMLSIETNSFSNEFAVPYPTYFHPKTRTEVETWQRQVRMVQRRYLFSFVGAPRPEMEESIRGEVIKQCLASQERCKFLNCDTPSKDCGNPVKVIEVFQDSVFCLQPPGDTPTRRSTFDSVLAGCIPVFFSLDSVQYEWHFPDDHTKYSVYISEEDVKDGKVSIEKVLSMISEEEILSMRNEVETIIPKIIYAKPGDVGPDRIEDAFEIALPRKLLMERETEPSSSTKLRRSDREEENVKIIEWEEFDNELTRLWSLSSALKLATEKKLTLQPKLESLIQVSAESLRRSNELEEMRQRLEAKKLMVDKTSVACRVTEQDVKKKEDDLSVEVRSLLVGGTTLSIAKTKLQESNCQLEGESGYAHLKNATNKLRKRQQYMITQVSFIYPLKIEAGPSQDQELESLPGGSRLVGTKHVSQGSVRILGLPFSMAPFTKMSFFTDKKEVQKSATALGYVAHAVSLLAPYLGVPIRYPLRLGGSKTYIRDYAPYTEPSASDMSPVSSLSEKATFVEFPLFLDGQDTTRAAYAVFLLNKLSHRFSVSYIFSRHFVEIKAFSFDSYKFQSTVGTLGCVTMHDVDDSKVTKDKTKGKNGK